MHAVESPGLTTGGSFYLQEVSVGRLADSTVVEVARLQSSGTCLQVDSEGPVIWTGPGGVSFWSQFILLTSDSGQAPPLSCFMVACLKYDLDYDVFNPPHEGPPPSCICHENLPYPIPGDAHVSWVGGSDL